MSDTVILHSRFNRLAAVFVWAVAALMAVTVIMDPAPGTLWLVPGALLVAAWGWNALWQPHVRVSDAGIRVENVTHRVDIPWEALVHVETRYALTLITPHGRFAAWAAPAPGVLRAAAAGRRADNRELRATGGPARPGDLLGTESGDAATVIREQWRARIESGQIAAGVADEQSVHRRPRNTAIAVLVIATAATAAMLALR